jgi:hypothetical protein
LNIDPILSLAVTVESNPGAYALLLGSGVSRAAGVPTGWEVTLDLVGRVAAAAKQDAGADPEAWYTARFGNAPLYSELVRKVTKSGAARARLFRSYFEPTDEEREEGMKVPTAGHHAIVRLVAGGYVRLILETNFDHLVENAIEQTAGIVPTVISSVDSLQGAAPLVQSSCTVVKLHGDYLDTRILNTEAELARYPRPLERYLDRVFDEFGLGAPRHHRGLDGETDVPRQQTYTERCGADQHRRGDRGCAGRPWPSSSPDAKAGHLQTEALLGTYPMLEAWRQRF